MRLTTMKKKKKNHVPSMPCGPALVGVPVDPPALIASTAHLGQAGLNGSPPLFPVPFFPLPQLPKEGEEGRIGAVSSWS